MKNKKFIIGVGVGLLSGIAGLVLIGMMRRTGNIQALEIPKVFKEVENTSEYDKTKLTLLDAIIDRYYIYPEKEFDAVEGIYKGYVYGLEDPYTVYLNEESFTKVTAEEKGNYVGVGIRFAWGATNQHLIVTEVIENSPASKEDIKIGDKIMLIDGIKAMASNEVEIYEKLAYAGKESVEYTFVDNDETNERKIKLVPKEVEIKLLHTEMLEENVGYIQLDGVAKGTAKEVETAVTELMNEGAERLVMDLRSVYTNELEEAVAIADLFLENQTICGVKDKKGEVG